MVKEFEEIKEQLDRIERNVLLSARKTLLLDDVSLLTGLSKSYLYKLVSHGHIPYFKRGGKILCFDRGEVEEWMRQGKGGAV